MDTLAALLESRNEISKLRVESANLCLMLKLALNHINDEEIKKIISNFLDSPDKSAMPDMMIKRDKGNIAKVVHPTASAKTLPEMFKTPKDDIQKKIKEARKSMLDKINKSRPTLEH